jgi:hypothetical protein
MLFYPFLGFPLGKKLAEKVQVFVVRPRHLDAPISFPRNRFQHCGIQESPRDVDDAPIRRNLQRKCMGLCAKAVQKLLPMKIAGKFRGVPGELSLRKRLEPVAICSPTQSQTFL